MDSAMFSQLPASGVYSGMMPWPQSQSTISGVQRLLEAVPKRRVDVVLVWRYDHFAKSTQALVSALMEFRALGVDFISHQEQVDTTTPQGELVFGMIASLAQSESALIGERVRAGTARARAQGRRISRPPIPAATRRRIEELARAGRSINAIHRELGIGYGTVWNYARADAAGRPRKEREQEREARRCRSGVS